MYVPRTDTQVSTYGTRLRARLDPRHVSNKSFGTSSRAFSDEYLDAKADQDLQIKLHGSTRKSKICSSCHTALPSTQICDYC